MSRATAIDFLLLKVSILNATFGLREMAAPTPSIDRARWRQQQAFGKFLWLLKGKAGKFDFVGNLSQGNILLVGEGNLSFSLSLSRKKTIASRQITASTFEPEKALSHKAKHNADRLRSNGTTVVHGVDAKNLRAAFGATRFDSIVFMFPNVASRKPNRGRNPNHRLLCRFLASAARQMKAGGNVIVAAVNKPHYLGAFNFSEAAEKTGYQSPEAYPFDPSDFPGYEHVMTHQEESALEEHDKFSLWVFRLK